jgi:hypothetical protein
MKTSAGELVYRGNFSKCFCGKPNDEHPEHSDGTFRVLCTGGIVLLNELAMINRSMEIINADHTDEEVYAWLLDLEQRGVSKARLKQRIRRTMDRIDAVYEAKPVKKPRAVKAPARKRPAR